MCGSTKGISFQWPVAYPIPEAIAMDSGSDKGSASTQGVCLYI